MYSWSGVGKDKAMFDRKRIYFIDFDIPWWLWAWKCENDIYLFLEVDIMSPTFTAAMNPTKPRCS